MKMKTVVFIEPPYRPDKPNQWALNGKYRYPSIIGSLTDHAYIMIAMPCVPPKSDKNRLVLENNFGVKFIEVPDGNARSVARCLSDHCIDIVSNLWGRPVNQLAKLIKIAQILKADFVMRVGGDDISTKAELAKENGKEFWGTDRHLQLLEVEKNNILASKRIIVMSELEAKRIKSIVKSERKQVFVCRRGVDQIYLSKDYIHSYRKIEKVVFVGRESPEKGSDILDEFADYCLTQFPDLKFVYVGEFVPQEKTNRIYAGFINPEKLHSFYRDADVFINCSRSEGFPQTVMEAMSIGLPCIIPKHLFQDEFSDQDGVLFSDNSQEDLANKLQLLLGNSSFFSQVGQQAKSYAEKNFDASKNNQFYINVLLGD